VGLIVRKGVYIQALIFTIEALLWIIANNCDIFSPQAIKKPQSAETVAAIE